MATANSKIFGIGLSKTGTTSLANALQIVGYRTKDNMGVVKYVRNDLSSVDLDVVEAFDALTDTPIPSFYRELDARFPGSRFILTVRDSDEWLKSCKKQFTQRFAELQTDAHKRLFLDLYGTDVFEEERFATGYERFVAGVRDYFKDRPGDLLTINVAAGEGWEKLCRFLGRPIPDIPFPKANVTQVRWMGIDEVIAVATEAGGELMRRFEDARRLDAPSDHRQRNQLHGAKRLFYRAAETVLGEDRVHAATRAAHKAICKGLTKLNATIPVVSRAGTTVPYVERKGWNHLWLVDPLDGEGAFASGDDRFSIDIALIEDGRPIYGVVYAPAMDTIYYGRVGKGALKRVQGQEAARLPLPANQPQPTANAEPRVHTKTERGRDASSYALAMCVLAEGAPDGKAEFESAMEWQTAAAHAVLSCAGFGVCEAESGKELAYNKKNLLSDLVKVA